MTDTPTEELAQRLMQYLRTVRHDTAQILWIDDIRDAAERLRSLQADLVRYGDHTSHCAVRTWELTGHHNRMKKPECTCDYSQKTGETE